MSGKFEKSRASRSGRDAKPARRSGRKDNTLLCAIIAVLGLILAVLVVYALSLEVYDAPGVPTGDPASGQETPSTDDPTRQPASDPATTPTAGDPTAGSTGDIQIQVDPEAEFDLGRGLKITDVGSYTGVYMEDGSDEIVSRILMAVVTNTSDRDLEYAEITLTGGETEAKFTVSTLPAGASAVLLEKTRMEFPGEGVFDSAAAENVSFFDTPMSLHEDVLKLQGLDGALNITNISGRDITGDIVIYYKNSSADMYYGGITYRVRLEGGLKAGEIRQIMTDHYSASGSTVLFVTYTQ